MQLEIWVWRGHTCQLGTVSIGGREQVQERAENHTVNPIKPSDL